MKQPIRTLMLLAVLTVALAALAQDAEPLPVDDEIVVRIEASEEPSLIDMLHRGGPLMYPLYLCSVVVLAFGIERAIRLRRSRILPAATVARIRRVGDGEDAPGPADLLREIRYDPSPIARVVAAGLRRVDRPLPELEKAIEDAGMREADTLRRGCRVLSITASVSPLLGLLGTVLGMIKAFMTVAAREEALGRTELLASGIYQALVTTAAGLAVAIPALVLYYIFVEKVDRLVSEMDDISIDLVETLRESGGAA